MSRTGAPTLACAAVLALGLSGAASSAVGGQVYDGTTVAAWTPPLTMRSAALSIATAPGGSSITGDAGAPMHLAPSAVSLSLTPPSPDVPLAPGGFGVDVAWGTDGCSTVRWTAPAAAFAKAKPEDGALSVAPTPVGAATEALPAQSPRRVCARLSTSVKNDELVQRFAGRTVRVRTTWSATTDAPLTWSTTNATNAVRSFPLPAPVAAAKPCTASGGIVSLGWAWPSATSTPVKGANGIPRWRLMSRLRGSGADWAPLYDIPGKPDARAQIIDPGVVTKTSLAPGTYDVTIRAYPVAGDEATYTDSADLWGITVATTKRLTCAPVADNTGTLLHGEAAK